MNKLIKGLAITGLVLVAFSTTTLQASAKRHYVKTPIALRGKWYNTNHSRETLNVTKYAFSGNLGHHNYWGLSGKKFIEHTSEPELYIGKSKAPHSYYWISRSGTDDAIQYKRITLKIKGVKYVALKERDLTNFNPVQYKITYWTHHKNLTR